MIISSKFTFSLIAIASLLVGGSGFLIQDAYALDAPEFTAIHLNTTATLITFDQNVNGTLYKLDWSIKNLDGNVCTAPCNTNAFAVAGETASDYEITDILNATASGTNTDYAGGADGIGDAGYDGGLAHLKATGQGWMNKTTQIVLIHAAIPSDATYFINYTANPNADVDTIAGGASGAINANVEGGVGAGHIGAENASVKYLKIGSNATAIDHMSPYPLSAEILKSNPKQIKVTMSETVANINATAESHAAFQDFTVTRTGGSGHAAVPAVFNAFNGTNYMYVTLSEAVRANDVLTLAYTSGDTANGLDSNWVTDGIDSTRYVTHGNVDGAAASAAGHAASGHGNKLVNFTGLAITNWLEIGMYGDVTQCFDCVAPVVTKVQISLDSSIPVTVTNDNAVHINAGIGDTVSVMVTVADNLGADSVPFAGLYTNFGDTPDNLYYSNNFDGLNQKSNSYYEWNVRTDDVAFGNTDVITWTEATATVNPDRTQTFTYTMTINDSLESSQVWVDLADKTGNYGKSALPITLEVSGAPSLTFASDDSQKVVSFFNESILLALVSQWVATSSDDSTNVAQLTSVLGVEDTTLPTWTTSLATWVAAEKIDVADMIVAVEYVINQ